MGVRINSNYICSIFSTYGNHQYNWVPQPSKCMEILSTTEYPNPPSDYIHTKWGPIPIILSGFV